MLALRRALKRKKLFEELDEKWKTYEGEVFHLIITLDPTQPTKNNYALSLKAERLGFTNWWIDTEDLQQMRQSLKPLVPILYTKEDNDELFRS